MEQRVLFSIRSGRSIADHKQTLPKLLLTIFWATMEGSSAEGDILERTPRLWQPCGLPGGFLTGCIRRGEASSDDNDGALPSVCAAIEKLSSP